jgi:hypothetical protein
MTEQDTNEINWTAAFIGFGVDWTFSYLIGLLVSAVMLAIKGVSFDSKEWPADVVLIGQIVGVGGAVVGGMAAGYLAGRRGNMHGVLGSIIGLFAGLCMSSLTLDLGAMGFVVLNLIGAGYGGGVGERWRARREGSN